MTIFTEPIKKRGHYVNLKRESARSESIILHQNPPSRRCAAFLLSEDMSNHTQENAVMELWREVIAMAIKDEDYSALAAMPVDLFIMLGMKEPAVSWEVENGYLLAEGCSRKFDPVGLQGDVEMVYD